MSELGENATSQPENKLQIWNLTVDPWNRPVGAENDLQLSAYKKKKIMDWRVQQWRNGSNVRKFC
jgi:hypothetical protein